MANIMKKYKHAEMSEVANGTPARGKLELHKRLRIDSKTEEPGLRVFNTCRNLLRTFPLLPTDKHNPEDVDTDAEDHAYDALRYGCMSRPLHPKAYDNESFIQTQKEKQFKPADRIFGY